MLGKAKAALYWKRNDSLIHSFILIDRSIVCRELCRCGDDNEGSGRALAGRLNLGFFRERAYCRQREVVTWGFDAAECEVEE